MLSNTAVLCCAVPCLPLPFLLLPILTWLRLPFAPSLPSLRLQDATSSLERLRTDLRSWTARVEAGELQDLGKEKQAAGACSRLC